MNKKFKKNFFKNLILSNIFFINYKYLTIKLLIYIKIK